MVAWEDDKIVRVTARLSVPTQVDRERFAMTRLRHQTLAPWVAQAFTIRRSPEIGYLLPLLPLVPLVGQPTAYETYVPSFGGPNETILAMNDLFPYPDVAKFITGVDHMANTSSDQASSWSVHDLKYEVLDDPMP